jgi:hypothetical protein
LPAGALGDVRQIFGEIVFFEVVRQQYNFSPPDTSSDSEDSTVELDGLTTLELNIIHDISGGAARTSLDQLRLA